MSVTFQIHPKNLADCIANAVEIGKEARSVQGVDHVLLTYQPDTSGKRGEVYCHGFGRYAAGRSRTQLEGIQDRGTASVSIDRDKAAELQSQLRKILGGKAASVSVSIYDEPTQVMVLDEHGMEAPSMVNLLISDGSMTVADLLDSDPAGLFDGKWDSIDEILAGADHSPAGPFALATEVVGRLGKIKGGGVADFRRTAHERILAVAIGADFRGVLGDVDRELYAVGGAHGDGPGDPTHLF